MAGQHYPEPVTVQDIKAKLTGLDNWLAAAATSAAGYDDNRIRDEIPGLVRRFEREALFTVNAIQVCAWPDGTYDGGTTYPNFDVTGTLEVYLDTPYPYYPEESTQYFKINLRMVPVQYLKVQRVRLMLDPSSTIINFPPNWFRAEPTGQLTIMPISGAVQIGTASANLAALQLGFGNAQYVPQMIACDYVAGLPQGWEGLRQYADLKRVLAEYCAMYVLQDISEMFGAGLGAQSLSAPAGSQSQQYSRFRDKVAYLRASTETYIQNLRRQNEGFLVGMV